MSNAPTPTQTSTIPGLNSNISVNDQVLHVQTEALGGKHSAIVTHVFSNGGQVVRVIRFDYGKYRDKPNLRDLLSRALQVQHTNAIRKLQQEGGVAPAPVASSEGPLESSAPAGFLLALSRTFRKLLSTLVRPR